MRIPLKHQARRVAGRDAGGWIGLPPLPARRGHLGRLLSTRGSLTAALRAHGITTVTVLRQQQARPNRDERGVLDARAARRRMVREVLLQVRGEPWVFAHTLANEPAQRLLRRAGRRPLATVLFTDPRVIAGGLYYRQLSATHPLAQRASALLGRPLAGLPARRALFVRGRARLLVTEVFLPNPAEANAT